MKDFKITPLPRKSLTIVSLMNGWFSMRSNDKKSFDQVYKINLIVPVKSTPIKTPVTKDCINTDVIVDFFKGNPNTAIGEKEEDRVTVVVKTDHILLSIKKNEKNAQLEVEIDGKNYVIKPV